MSLGFVILPVCMKTCSDLVLQDITPPCPSRLLPTICFATGRTFFLIRRARLIRNAYIEIPRANVRDALRAVQNKTMGKGKRLRGVTVTMSNQGELMRAVRQRSSFTARTRK